MEYGISINVYVRGKFLCATVKDKICNVSFVAGDVEAWSLSVDAINGTWVKNLFAKSHGHGIEHSDLHYVAIGNARPMTGGITGIEQAFDLLKAYSGNATYVTTEVRINGEWYPVQPVEQQKVDERRSPNDTGTATEPEDAAKWAILGMSFNEQSKHREAVECFNNAVAVIQDVKEIWYNKGIAHVGLGQIDEAIACYNRALALDPKYILALNNKGSCLLRLGLWDEALGYFDRVLKLDSQRATAWINRGRCLEGLARLKDALGCYDRAAKLDPDKPAVWHARCSILAKLGCWDEALADFARLAKLDTDFAAGWFLWMGSEQDLVMKNLQQRVMAITPFLSRTLPFDEAVERLAKDIIRGDAPQI